MNNVFSTFGNKQQERIQPVRSVGGTISIIFGNQVHNAGVTNLYVNESYFLGTD